MNEVRLAYGVMFFYGRRDSPPKQRSPPKLEQLSWKTLEHYPYRRGDFHVFGSHKEALEGQRFNVEPELESYVCI